MRVILLMGPSSVGKSSLCAELVKTHGWKEASLDTAIFLMDRKSDLIKLKPELERQVRFSGLSKLMSEREILTLCLYSKLSLSRQPNIITDYQFSNPELPGLEEVLRSAGFSGNESATLSKKMREVVKAGLDMPVYMLYDIVFSTENQNETVVVDIFPLPNGVISMLEDFASMAEKFRIAHPDINLTTQTVLAYCPPQFLSNRILERNKIAKEEGRSSDERVGLFPFEQLSTVLTAFPTQTPDPLQQDLTKDELFDIVKRHSKSSNNGPIFIEEHIDPSIMTQDMNQSADDDPRIGTDEQIKEYRNLRDKFGFTEGKASTLNIRHRDAFNIVIDTSKASADSLARTLVADLDLLSTQANTFRRP